MEMMRGTETSRMGIVCAEMFTSHAGVLSNVKCNDGEVILIKKALTEKVYLFRHNSIS